MQLYDRIVYTQYIMMRVTEYVILVVHGVAYSANFFS